MTEPKSEAASPPRRVFVARLGLHEFRRATSKRQPYTHAVILRDEATGAAAAVTFSGSEERAEAARVVAIKAVQRLAEGVAADPSSAPRSYHGFAVRSADVTFTAHVVAAAPKAARPDTPGARRRHHEAMTLWRLWLLGVLATRGPLHGEAVLDALAELGGGILCPARATVYGDLKVLHAAGLIASEPGRGRRVEHRITSEGAAVAREQRAALAAVWRFAEPKP